MSGYLDQVEIEGSPEEDAKTARDNNRVFLIGGALLLGLFLLLDVLSWFTERGGIFSIVSAFATVHSKPPILDVDKNGLLLLFTILSWFTAFGICRAFRLQFDVSARAKALLPALSIVGAAFILSGVFGEPIISAYMAHHGYNRCTEGDWAQGNGKSRVWFAHYVLSAADCRPHRG